MHIVKNLGDLPSKCMFFGYGSLMYYTGINGRGLDYLYKSNKELTPVNVKGLRRSMSAEVQINFNRSVRFYSVAPAKNDEVYGMLFKIHSRYDLIALLRNEGARPVHFYGHYKLYDITDLFDDKQGGALPKFTLIHEELEDRPDMYYPGYVERVYNGIAKEHRQSFLDTGGVKPTRNNSNSNLYRYFR